MQRTMSKQKPPKPPGKTSPGDDSKDPIGPDWVARTVRFPPDLYEKIKEDAAKDRRSVQLHIVWLIEFAFLRLESLPKDDDED